MATTGGLFGSKPATGGLFGASTTTPAPSGGGLFGGAAATPNTGGSLFGSAAPAAATPTPTTGGGLFGAQPAAATTGATGGLFGTTASTQQQQQPTSAGGLFGGTTQPTTTPTVSAGGLFGQSTVAQPKPAGGLFTQSTVQPAQVSAVQINYDSLRPRSRFDDLAQPVQGEIEMIDKGIQRVIKMRDEIGQFMPQHGRDIEQLGRDVSFVEGKFKTVQDALNRDIQTVKVLQDMTKKSIADGQLSFKAADNLKLPTHYHQTGLFATAAAAAAAAAATAPVTGATGDDAAVAAGSADAAAAHASAQDLISYFNRVCDDVERYKRRLDEYRSQIERDMPGVENGLYEQIRSLRDHSCAPVTDQLNQVLLALKETGGAIVAQAGVIAETRERMSRLQAGYLDNTLYV